MSEFSYTDEEQDVMNDTISGKEPEYVSADEETHNTDNPPDVSPAEYVHRRYENFVSRYSGNNNVEEEWKMLRSQINAALKLGIAQYNITNFICMEYDYETREVFKYALWSGINPEKLEEVRNSSIGKSWREIMIIIENTRLDKNIADVIDKPLDSMSQMLSAITDTVNRLSIDNDNKKKEYEEKVAKLSDDNEILKKQLSEKEKEIEQLISETDEENRYNKLERQMREMKENHEKELLRIKEQEELRRQREEITAMRENAQNEIEKKAEELATKRFEQFKSDYAQKQKEIDRARAEEQKKAEDAIAKLQYKENEKNKSEFERLKKENALLKAQQDKKKKFFFQKKADAIIPDNESQTKQYSLPDEDGNLVYEDEIESLPTDFNIGMYALSKNLPQDIIELVATGVKCGCPDIELKKMIDRGYSAVQLRSVLEIYLVKKAKEERAVKENDEETESEEAVEYV